MAQSLSPLVSFIREIQVFLILWLLLLTNHGSNSTISQDFTIEEDKPVGTHVGKLLGQGPYQVLVNSQVSASFTIDQTTGDITIRTLLDRESLDIYSFIAVPITQNGEPLRVTIRVSDVNDNSPTFERSTLTVTMSENAPKDTKPSLGSASDPDLGQNTTQLYEITSGNVGNAFRLAWRRASNNELYCDLLVNGVLDYETRKRYDLKVTAYDGGTPRLSSSLQVIVDILDSNDNQPIFNTSRYSSRVLENATIGTSVARVFATDLDTGINGRVRYYIDRSRSDPELVFGIDETSGVIQLNKGLDYETKSSYELIVVARDSGVQPLETTAIVSVHVGDVNDHQPDIDMIFLTDEGQPRLPEDAEPGFFLARISVSDKDTENVAPLNVTLLGGDGHFDLTSRDNIVYLVIVSNPVDREMKPFYQLTVVAKDSGSPPLTTNRTFTVKVLDTNDNEPQFSKPLYRTSVQETALPGSSVLQVTATDLDTGRNARISYSIVPDSSNHSEWFRVDGASGLITTSTVLDCETHSEPRLVVVARDDGVEALESRAVVVVSIRDENDNHPVFDQSFYTVGIPEDKAPGSCVLKVSATDPDCGVNAQVTYTLPDNLLDDTRKHFEIRNVTGDICIIGTLDYETRSQYEFTVIAKDGDGLQSTSIVKIFLTNVNDHLPIFYPDNYAVNLVPDSAAGTEVAAVRATDADRQGALTYRISSGNARNLFSIHQNTGVIRLVSPLTPGVSVYDLIIQAADNDDYMSRNTARVRISIIETSQAPPVFTRSLYTLSVAEDAGVGSVLETVRADNSDPSLGAITYSITAGDQNGYIAVNSQTGVLSVQKTMDREQQSSLLLSIQAESGNPPRFNQAQANITITDINDNTPLFSSRDLDLVVKENVKVNSAIYQVHATDLDSGNNGDLTYTITSSPQTVFNLDSRTGLLTLARLLDYELEREYRLTVQARDAGTPAPRSSSQTLRISVEDVNDNTPQFGEPAYLFSLVEATEVNTKFGVVTASDKDSGNNAKLMYALEPESSIFGIFPNDGNLYVKKALDREGQHQYVFNVLVRDNGAPRRSARVPVTITVEDINDHDPVFEKASYAFTIGENLQPGHVVGSVLATDADSGVNAEISYSLNVASTEFAISSRGRVRTLTRLDREVRARYVLAVVARDGGSRPRSALVEAVVDVGDVNDNAPVWRTVSGGEVAENSPLGTRVMQISAGDEDVGNNGNVTYALQVNADSAPFHVDAITGWLTTRRVLDYEEKQSYMLTLIARDHGNPQRQSLQTILVKVKDVDEGSTDNPTENLTIHVSEDILVGTRIADLTSGGSSVNSATYFMTSGNDLANFEVNMITGALYLVRPLDHELQKRFNLEIKAKNSQALFSRSTTIYVVVMVTDVNDNRPTFADDPILITVKENTELDAEIYQFQATDPDSFSNGTVRYRIVSTVPAGDYFQLDTDTGKLTTKVALNYEQIKQISVVVEAEDQAPLGSRLRTRVTAHVFVRDVNDHVPVFRSTSLVELSENEGVDYPILHVIADDRDSGEAGRVTYSITTDDVDGTFTLDTNTGLLTLARRLDRTQPLHTLNITARDHGTPRMVAWQQVQIKVLSVEDNPPVFDKAQYLAVVMENRPSGQTLVTVRATDPDNAGSVISYSLADGFDKFTINRQSGLITTTKTLDREQQDSYTITAYASSSMTSEVVSSVSITVTVQDDNDHRPSFVVSTYTINIPENTAYQGFYTVTAADQDVGQNGQVRYFITDGDPDNKFIIGLTSGELSCDALDAETKRRYNLTITAQDMSMVDKLSGTMSLIVLVGDLNDNDPVFSKTSYQASIPENIEVDKSVVMVTAEDRDQGANGNVLHSLGPGTGGAFRIDAGSGEIRTTRSFDREKLSSYRFDVLATDGGLDRPRTVRVPVTITVTDVNDSPPVFVQIPYTATVQLNHPSGGQIVQVSATDQDLGQNGVVTYTLTSSSAYFTVDEASGNVRTKRLLDNAATGYHTLVVMATDRGTPSLSSQGFVKIRVGNPIGVSDLEYVEETYNKTLYENAPRESPVVQVKARFTNTGSSSGITYSIVSGNGEQAYSVDRNTGYVRVNDQRGVDYESYHQRRLVVMAEGGGASAYTSVWLRLQDQNDNPPTFTHGQYVSSVMEGVAADTLVTEVTATDLDEGSNGDIRYYIINGNHDNSFYLPSDSSGLIKTKSVLDREILNVYTLEIEATDTGQPPLSSTCTVRISVVDANDNSPFFPIPRPINVPESTPVGTTLTQVTANDVDMSPALIYSFRENGNPGNLFGLDHFSGKISLVKQLDYETQRSYTVELEATDGEKKAYASLTVRVRDENDNTPRFTQDNYQASLSTSADLGQSIVTVHAQDPDSGDNARLSYDIVNSTYPGGLFLDSNTGVISTSRAVQGSLTSIGLLVRARDDGTPRRSSTAAVRILVKDGAGPAPAFENSVYKASIEENSPSGTSVTTVSASSGQQENQPRLYYSIVSGDVDRVFTIVRHSGEIVLLRDLDRELTASYTMRVKVKDARRPTPRSSTATVQILVTDVNDCVPVFDQKTYARTLVESLGTNSQILRVFAHDADSGSHAQVDYTITSGNDRSQFVLDRDTGWLSLVKPLDRESSSSHRLVVGAQDCRECSQAYPLAGYATVIINVTDIDEHDPVFPGDSTLYKFVKENSEAGTLVFTAHAQDEDDSAVLHYTLIEGGDDFRIESTSGRVLTRRRFDYEVKNVYPIRIRVRDGGSESPEADREQRVDVRVVDVDEYEPVFVKSEYEFSVRGDAQPGDVIGRVEANDGDGGEAGSVFYSLRETSPYFTVDARLGIVTVTQPLNGVSQNREKRDVTQSRDVISRRERDVITRQKRDVVTRLLRRRKRSTEPLRQDKVRLAVEASSGLPDSKSTVVVIDCTVNRTCTGCTAPLPVTGGLYGTSLVLVLVFTCLLVLIIIVIIILLLVRVRRNKKQQAARQEQTSPYNIFPLHSTVASGYQAGLDHSDMDLPPPYTNGGTKHVYINPACSTHQNSDLSHSSGRGSALAGIDDDIDEELHIINSSPYSPDTTSRLQPDSGIQHDETDVDNQSVTTHQQYLARLGIDVYRLNSNIEKTQHGSHLMKNLPQKRHSPRGSDVTVASSRDRHNTTASTSISTGDDPDISNLIHEQLSEIDNFSDISRIGSKLNHPVLSSVVNTEEELGGSYNWDYLLDWGPQYQPLAEVFNEIAKLKDEDIQPKRRPTHIVPQQRVLAGQKGVKSSFPPPMITDTPPLMIGQSGSSRSSQRSSDVGSIRPPSVSSSVRITPRSPIVHDNSPGVYMPSFTPTLTPLGTSAPQYPVQRHGAPFGKAPQLRSQQQQSVLPTLSGQLSPTSLQAGSQPVYPRTLQVPRPRVPAGKPHYPRPTAVPAGPPHYPEPTSAPTMHLSSGSEQEFRI